jgi:hypothetical protein
MEQTGMEIKRYGSTCKIKQVKNSDTVDAEVYDFIERQTLTVVVGRAVKVPMKWNGKLYEGRMAGLDFTTEGPTVTKTKVGSRG